MYPNSSWNGGNYNNGNSNRNNGNFNGNSHGNGNTGRSGGSRISQEQRDRAAVLKTERQQARNQKKEERFQFSSQWPEIRVDFEPAFWQETYKKMHSETLAQSISKLQQLEELSAEEAERKVYDILVKTTFIELNLVKNGGQKVEKLFENLQLATGESEKMPFKSPADLEDFLKSMAPVFRMDVRTKNWCNTGVQTRRFCQYLMERLQLGDVIEKANFDETLAEFKTTIKEDNETAQTFAEKEAILDFTSYLHLARAVPEFSYDRTTGRLSLNKDVFFLALHLPILADTLHSSNPKKLDSSRMASTYVSQYHWSHPNRGAAVGVCQELDGVKATAFWNKFEIACPKLLLSVSGPIIPNSKYETIEVMEVEPFRLDFSNNFVASKGHMLMDEQGKKGEATFDNIQLQLRDSKQGVSHRIQN